MLDKPITLRRLMHAALFVCFFPFSMPFYFPRTSLACVAGVVLMAILISHGAMR